MSITESILTTCLQDLSICQHLYTKLDPEKAQWRPRENMRSTLELLQYLASIYYVTNPSDREKYRDASSITFEEFPNLIEERKNELRGMFQDITDNQLTGVSESDTGIFNNLTYIMRVLTAYRHELFLHAKMCGADISTSNDWRGHDMPKPE
jgi:hypothetical protein